MAYIWNLVTELKRSVVYAKGALSFGNIERSIRTPLLGGRWSFSFLELLSVLAAGKLALFGHYMLSCSLRLSYLHGDKKFFSETG
jgi:hypothetical protein